MANFRCERCGYMYTGEAPPAACPECGAGAEEFYNIDEDQELTYEDSEEDAVENPFE